LFNLLCSKLKSSCPVKNLVDERNECKTFHNKFEDRMFWWPYSGGRNS